MAGLRTMFLGFPIRGETAPPVILSFLSSHDLSVKTLVLFTIHAESLDGKSTDWMEKVSDDRYKN